MKRRTLRILICLVLGVVSTVGVAWGLALCLPVQSARVMANAQPVEILESIQSGVRSNAVLHERFGHVVWYSALYRMNDEREAARHDGFATEPPPRDALPHWTGLVESGDSFRAGDFPGAVEQVAEAAGWPLLATRCTYEQTTVGVVRTSGIPIFGPSQDIIGHPLPRTLPLRPIFPGFIINTLFYAAIWFGLFAGIGFAKRFIRMKKGRCVMCGYDLRGDFASGCSECGWGRE